MTRRFVLAAALACWVAAPGCGRREAAVRERFVDVDAGGHRVHMLIAGDAGPTVVLESGWPGGLGWEAVRREVGRFARVVTYDRAGIGKSESGPTPRDARQIATELHTALRSAGLGPPYVMVGQSMGGPYVRVFAGMYPRDVAGMVLVDPSPPEGLEPVERVEEWFKARHPEQWGRVAALAGRGPAGMESWVVSPAKAMEEYLETLPERRREAVRREWWATCESIAAASAVTPELSPGARDEAKAAPDTIREALAAPVPPVPVVLLVAGQPGSFSEVSASLSPNMRMLLEAQRGWKFAVHKRWADSVPGVRMVVLRRGEHNMQNETPDVVIGAIRDVLGGAHSGDRG